MRKHETKSTGLRIVIASIAALFFGVTLFVVTSAFVFNSDWFMNLAKAKLTDYIGQEVAIDSIDIDLGQIIRLRVENISVANPPWASTLNLASVDMLEVGLDVLELLSGDLVLTEVRLDEPVLHLERSISGTANWAMAEDGTSSSPTLQVSERQSEDNSELNLPRIESFLIEEGRLTYVDPQHTTSIDLSFNSSNRQTLEDQYSIVSDGGGIFLGQPITINLSAGPPPMLVEKDTNGYPLKLQLSFC